MVCRAGHFMRRPAEEGLIERRRAIQIRGAEDRGAERPWPVGGDVHTADPAIRYWSGASVSPPAGSLPCGQHESVGSLDGFRIGREGLAPLGFARTDVRNALA